MQIVGYGITFLAPNWTSKSLKMYLFAFRNHNSFHEEVVNRILEDIVAACDPREITVYGEFMPRGGISLDIEASHKKK